MGYRVDLVTAGKVSGPVRCNYEPRSKKRDGERSSGTAALDAMSMVHNEEAVRHE